MLIARQWKPRPFWQFYYSFRSHCFAYYNRIPHHLHHSLRNLQFCCLHHRNKWLSLTVCNPFHECLWLYGLLRGWLCESAPAFLIQRDLMHLLFWHDDLAQQDKVKKKVPKIIHTYDCFNSMAVFMNRWFLACVSHLWPFRPLHLCNLLQASARDRERGLLQCCTRSVLGREKKKCKCGDFRKHEANWSEPLKR